MRCVDIAKFPRQHADNSKLVCSGSKYTHHFHIDSVPRIDHNFRCGTCVVIAPAQQTRRGLVVAPNVTPVKQVPTDLEHFEGDWNDETDTQMQSLGEI